MLKVITPQNVVTVPADRVQPGHIILQGVVLAVTNDREGGPTWYETAGQAVFADEGAEVQVYGKVTDRMLEAIRAAVAK